MPLMKILFLISLNFSMVVSMKTLFRHVIFCHLMTTTENSLLSWHLTKDKTMANNNLPIHVESGNIFYRNFNTNENFYSFLIAQQDETTAIITKRVSYHYKFEKYINKHLPSFSIDDAEKFDLFANKNSKYVFYKFNDRIEALVGEKRII